jgi:hypothetical protein
LLWQSLVCPSLSSIQRCMGSCEATSSVGAWISGKLNVVYSLSLSLSLSEREIACVGALLYSNRLPKSCNKLTPEGLSGKYNHKYTKHTEPPQTQSCICYRAQTPSSETSGPYGAPTPTRGAVPASTRQRGPSMNLVTHPRLTHGKSCQASEPSSPRDIR